MQDSCPEQPLWVTALVGGPHLPTDPANPTHPAHTTGVSFLWTSRSTCLLFQNCPVSSTQMSCGCCSHLSHSSSGSGSNSPACGLLAPHIRLRFTNCQHRQDPGSYDLTAHAPRHQMAPGVCPLKAPTAACCGTSSQLHIDCSQHHG